MGFFATKNIVQVCALPVDENLIFSKTLPYSIKILYFGFLIFETL